MKRILIACIVMLLGCGSKQEFQTKDLSGELIELQQKAEQNDPESQAKLGAIYAFGYGVSIDYSKAHKLLQSAAEKDNAKALWTLSFLYEMGLGVPDNPLKAKEYRLKAAELGESQA